MAKKRGKATGDEPVPGPADESAAIPDYADGFESLAKFDDDAQHAGDAADAGEAAADEPSATTDEPQGDAEASEDEAPVVKDEPAAEDDAPDADEPEAEAPAVKDEPAAEDDTPDEEPDADEPEPEELAADEPVPDELADDEPEVDESEDALLTEAEQIAARVASARPVRKTEAEAKGRATPKQERATKTEERPRVGPITFVKQSIDELKKVNWPSLDQWQQYFIVVLVFVLVIIAYVGLLDLGLGYLLLKIFGDA